jgi:hypothetical protein
MKQTIKIIVIISISWNSWGQVEKIEVNGKDVKIYNVSFNCFEFNPLDTTLTKNGLERLNEFGKFYKDSLLPKQNYLISLSVGLTKEEKDAHEELALKRVMIIISYLERNFEIKKNEFMERYTETVTTEACVGFLVSESAGYEKKPTRKKKWKLKKKTELNKGASKHLVLHTPLITLV